MHTKKRRVGEPKGNNYKYNGGIIILNFKKNAKKNPCKYFMLLSLESYVKASQRCLVRLRKVFFKRLDMIFCKCQQCATNLHFWRELLLCIFIVKRLKYSIKITIHLLQNCFWPLLTFSMNYFYEIKFDFYTYLSYSGSISIWKCHMIYKYHVTFHLYSDS